MAGSQSYQLSAVFTVFLIILCFLILLVTCTLAINCMDFISKLIKKRPEDSIREKEVDTSQGNENNNLSFPDKHDLSHRKPAIVTEE